LFNWKTLLTHQFSLLTEWEGVNQGYAWYNFWISSIKQGTWPIWDPFTFAGSTFAGEMQTAAFYPVHLLLALVPFNRNGMFSPQLYHIYIAAAHFIAARFMFALIREFGLSRLAAFLAGICFSLGGFIGRMGWPHQVDSSMWLPVIFLFVLRALRSETMREALVRSSLAGLGVGMSILAGGLHVTIMEVLTVVTAVAWYGSASRDGFVLSERRWSRLALIAGTIVAIGLAAGAVQLLASAEYSTRALRYLGMPEVPTVTGNERIPYRGVQDGLWPYGFFFFVFPTGFASSTGPGEVINPYFGVFPFLLAIVGVWKNWANLWVRYFTGIAIAGFLYSLGSFSLLHGVLYAVVPFLSLAREAGRFLFLSNFGLAILAGFGVEALFATVAQPGAWSASNRILKWVVIGCLLALAGPAVFGRPQMNPWSAFSLLMILLSCALFRYAAAGRTGPWMQFLMMLLVLFDLSAFDWSARNKIEVAKNGTDHLEVVTSCRHPAEYLKSQPGPFRIQVLADSRPNVGDVFGIQTVNGAGASLLTDYTRLMGNLNLLNVRYTLRPASFSEPDPVYQDSAWKVYSNPGAFPRAWLVHNIEIERSPSKLIERVFALGAEARRIAIVGEPLGVTLGGAVDGAGEAVAFDSYHSNRMEMNVRANSRGLLVLSEMYYPGWQATVNGRPAHIYKVDGGLRGIVVPAGQSRVLVHYAPGLVYAGALLTILTFAGVFASQLLLGRPRRSAVYAGMTASGSGSRATV
jgi:hypothetical protein